MLSAAVSVSHRKLLTLQQPRHISSRTLRFSFPNSYERCFSACVRIMWECHRAVLNTCQRGTNSNPHFFELQKHPHRTAAGAPAAAAVSCSSNGTTPVNVVTLKYIGTPALPPFPLATPQQYRDFKSPTSRRGTLYHVLHQCTGGWVTWACRKHTWWICSMPARVFCNSFHLSSELNSCKTRAREGKRRNHVLQHRPQEAMRAGGITGLGSLGLGAGDG